MNSTIGMAQSQPSQPPVWDSYTPEEDDLDEPPEMAIRQPTPKSQFQRTAIRKPADQSSLLTKAFLKQSDDELHEPTPSILRSSQRRRSITSNISFASTADLTSDTGLTSPSRTNTPSPPVPEMAMLRLHSDAGNKDVAAAASAAPAGPVTIAGQEAPKEAPRKRCIQFVCGKPDAPQQPAPIAAAAMVKTPSAQEQPRRPCIRFACPPRPASTQNTPPKHVADSNNLHPNSKRSESPSTPRKSSAIAAALSPSRHSPSSRSPSARRLSNKSPASRPKYLRANSKDLVKDGSQFHEFASGLSREDDWIRQDHSRSHTKITINDTLTKEINFRRLADEAEEEEELEREARDAIAEEYEDEDEDENEDDEDDLDEEDEEEDEDEEYDSDGYYTDEETGFAESEEEDEEDDGMRLWTPSAGTVTAQVSSVVRRTSVDAQMSDSSIESIRRVKARRFKPEAETPDLPDSTDFVCGTLDEDRPLEEAYMSELAARRNEKLRVIPQDIDPSFPTSEPDDDDDAGGNSETEGWMHGEMEDLQQGGRRRSEQASPRKYHSPPPRRCRSPPPPKAAAKAAPKRHHSPPLRTAIKTIPKRLNSPVPNDSRRCRSPTRLFDARSPPKRARSPAPRCAFTTPIQSPRHGANVKFHLAGRPGMTTTKSLPRPAAMFGPMKHARYHQKHQRGDDAHVRGAIDIVKGLEQKRQRRSEKFYQKYCNRARRGQIPERKAQPGKGAERMKELGLLMAGKKDQGNYVLSI